MIIAALVCALLVAVVSDATHRRIPNALVLPALLVGVVMQGLLAEGVGFGSSLFGALLGFGLLLPLYLLRAMGAGDVKLMSMVGAFVGTHAIVPVVLATLVVGGLMALSVAIAGGNIRNLLRNLRFMSVDAATRLAAGQAPVPRAPARSIGKLPYAVAIAGGTAVALIWQRYAGLA